MSTYFHDLVEAYKAIHTLREFADRHSAAISLVVETRTEWINPIAILHDKIQAEFYVRWMAYGGVPFVHNGKIAWWDKGYQRISFVELVDSRQLAEPITPQPMATAKETGGGQS